MKITIHSDKDYLSILADHIYHSRVKVTIFDYSLYRDIVVTGDFVGFISEVYEAFENEGIVLTNRDWVGTRYGIEFDLIKEIEVL